MSGPTYVIIPVQADGAQNSEPDTAKLASAIQQSLQEKTRPEDHDGQRDTGTKTHLEDRDRQEDTGPWKEIIAHQDSLYKYISWEDPLRTIGSYIGVLSFLLGVHYLPLTQLGLKAGAATLGVISTMEFAGRVFGPNTFLAHLRPKEYKKIPESTLNATLKDIHDLIQYAAVQVQRIIFGQDLDKTFAAFLGFTALYWLIQVMSPFGLAVLGLTSVYIASLITTPRGREVAHDAKLRSGELAIAAADKGTALAQDGKAKAAELSSKVRDTGIDMQRRVGDLAQGGKETAADLSTRAQNTASDVSQATAENARKLPEMGTNAINQAPGTVKSAASDAQQYIHSSLPGIVDGNSGGNRSVTGGAANKLSQLSNNAVETTKQMVPDGISDSATSVANKVSQLSNSTIGTARHMAPEGHTTHRVHYPNPALQHLENTAYSMPGQTTDERTGSVADSISRCLTAGDTAATHGLMYQR